MRVEVLCDDGELYGTLGDYSRLARSRPAVDDVTDEQLDVLVDLILAHLFGTGTPMPARGRKLSRGTGTGPVAGR